MSFWDGLEEQQKTQQAPSSGSSFWDGLGTATSQPATKLEYKPFTGAGYFPATDLNKSSTDPYSGRPFQGYTLNIPASALNPAVNVPLVDTRRVAAGFDPTKAQPLPKEILENPRMSEAASQAIKSALHGGSTDELDHIIALGLSGSNAPANLQIQPGIKGGAAAKSDELENSLIEQVKNGQISLIDAQNQLAKSKGITLPEYAGQRSAVDQWLMDNPNVLEPLAGLQSSIESIPKSFLGNLANLPKDAISPIVDAWNGIKDAAVNTVSEFTSQGRPTSEKAASVANLISSSANAVFLPITEAFNIVKDIPVVGGVTNLIALPFEMAGTAGSIAAKSALNALPLSQQDKNNLMDAASKLGALAGQIALGFGMEKAAALTAMKDTTTELLNRKQAGETITPKIAEDTLKRKIDEVKKEKAPQAIKPNEVKPEVNPETKTEIKPEVNPETKFTTIEIPEPTQPTKTIELTSGLNPNLDKFIEQDIKPAAKAVIGGVGSAFKTLKDLFVPTKSSEEAVKTASILRTELAKQAREKELLYHKISDARKVFDRYTPQQAIDFIDKIETGKPIEGSENFVKVIRDAFDSRQNKIQDINGTSAYIANYFPHLWKDPKKAAETLAKYFSKRPFEGTKSFLKQRKIPLMKDGVALGLEPISYNPVDLVMARIADMDKFIMAHNVVDAFKKEGLMKFVRFGEKPPEGWARINDKIGEAYQFSETEKGLVKRGTYYMPKDAARIINNYLSPGLQGNPIYDVFRKLGNTMTQTNLGLSGFHGLFTSNDAMISKFSLGLQQLSRGEAEKFIRTSLETPTYSFRNVIHGNKLLEDYFRENPQMPELVDALIRAGGRVRMDSFYKNSAVEGFLKALRSENYLGAAVRTPGALIEEVAKPILQELVPRQKLGVFMDLAKDILEQAKKEDWSDAKTTLRLQEAWDSVDNRLGELVYDNLFWNKALKDLSMASVRAVGWNLGTIRELGGGLKDIASIPYKLITGGEIRMTPRMAYTIALPIVTGVEGAILNYLFTGKYPETLLDYYYPKTGRKNPDGTDERVSLPSYMKDVFAVGKEGLFKVASNKLNPIFSTIIDMLENRDYYGTEIRNANDPLVKQIGQEFQFLASQFEPFSIQSAIRGQSPLAKYGSFVGITVAPSYITQTPLEKKISGMYEYRFGKTTQTKEQKEKQDFLNQIRKAYIAGDKETANKLLHEAEQKGYFATKAVESKFVGDSDLPSSVRMFRRLPSEDQEKLLKDMNLAELNQYAWYASKSVKSKLSTLSDNAKQFVEMVNNGEIKQPVWKAGKIINQ